MFGAEPTLNARPVHQTHAAGTSTGRQQNLPLLPFVTYATEEAAATGDTVAAATTNHVNNNKRTFLST